MKSYTYRVHLEPEPEGGYTVEAFRTLVQTGDEQATPEIVVEHLAQHEAEHRGAIWEARVAAEAELGIG